MSLECAPSSAERRLKSVGEVDGRVLPLFLARPKMDLFVALERNPRRRLLVRRLAMGAGLIGFGATGVAVTLSAGVPSLSSAPAMSASVGALSRHLDAPERGNGEQSQGLSHEQLSRAMVQWRAATLIAPADRQTADHDASKAPAVAAPTAGPMEPAARLVLQLTLGAEDTGVLALPLKLLAPNGQANDQHVELKGTPSSWTVARGPTGMLYLTADSPLRDQKEAFEVSLVGGDGRVDARLSIEFDLGPAVTETRQAKPTAVAKVGEGSSPCRVGCDQAGERSRYATSTFSRGRIGERAGSKGTSGTRPTLGRPMMVGREATKPSAVSGASERSDRAEDQNWDNRVFLGGASP